MTPTRKLARKIIWENKRAKKFIPSGWKVSFIESRNAIEFEDTGSVLAIDGSDEYESLVGQEFDIFVGDEIKEWKRIAYEEMYPNRAARDGIWIVGGSRPMVNNEGGVLYEELLSMAKAMKDRWGVHSFTSADNPFFGDDIEVLRRQYEASNTLDIFYTQYLNLPYRGGKRLLFPAYNEQMVHPHDALMSVLRPDRENLQYFMCLDPGFATCFAVLFAAYNPYTSEIIILDEIYETNRMNTLVHKLWPRIFERVLEFTPWDSSGASWRAIYDYGTRPELPFEIRSQFPKHEVPFVPTVKSGKKDEDRDAWCRRYNEAMSQGMVRFSGRCLKTVWETENYYLDENGRYPTENDHQIDNLRYLLKYLNYSPKRFREAPVWEERRFPHTVGSEMVRVEGSSSFDIDTTATLDEEDLWNWQE